MAEQAIIETSELRKDFDMVEALRGLNLQVPAGSICGFLGRNGAGKTTTLKILLGIARPSRGSARVFGVAADDPRVNLEIRRRSAFVSEEKELYPYMTVEETIRFAAPLFPRWRSDLEERYVRAFALPRTRKVKALSRGARTQLALLLALCRGAELLLLDEPTSGLDPAMAEEVLQALVGNAGNEGTSVFFSSHQIGEVEQICDRVAIIDRGRCVIDGTIEDVRENFHRIQLVFDGDPPDVTFRSPGIVRILRSGRVLTIVSRGDRNPLIEEVRSLNPQSVDVLPMTLKDIFLEASAEEK